MQKHEEEKEPTSSFIARASLQLGHKTDIIQKTEDSRIREGSPKN